MENPAFNIVDDALRHGQSACHDRAPAHFRWRWLDPEDGFDFLGEPVFFTDRSIEKAKFYSAGRKIAWILEPRAVQEDRYQWIVDHADEFDTVLTFDRALIESNPEKFRYFAFGGCWIRDEQIGAYPKTKRCSIIASAKAVTAGQKLRHEVIEQFGDRLDIYGRGYQPIDSKFEALRDYELTIVIENCQQDDYFSEKLIDALATGTVPLYWGTDQVGSYFPNGIHPFNNLDRLAELLEEVKPDTADIQDNLSRIEKYKVPEDWIWNHCKDLFLVANVNEPIAAKPTDFLNGGSRYRKMVSTLEQKLTSVTEGREKARAERERYRAERDTVRDERNNARAERDEAVKALANPHKTEEPELFTRHREELMKQAEKSEHRFDFSKEHVITHQINDTIDKAHGHYFYQDLHVARRIFQEGPEKHVDIASQIDEFIAHLAVFRDVEVFDFSFVPAKDSAITFRQVDLMQLDEQFVEYANSVSSLHVIEHFGLGRYGDLIDYEGHLKGIENMFRVVKPGGRFYLSTLIGPQRIHFNAHRVFSARYLVELGKKWGDLDRIAYVGDDGHLHTDVSIDDDAAIDNNFGCHCGSGIFEWIKR